MTDLPYTLTEVPIRDAYTFDGWYSNPGLTGDPVTIITLATRGNKVLYAS
jgi:uncharacterized repeat protein (TIGR02543 family)